MIKCNPCNKPEEHEIDNCKCTIKQLVDECSGKTINYITLAAAVLMDCGSEETVKQAIEDLRNKLDNKLGTEDIEALLHLMTVYLNSHKDNEFIQLLFEAINDDLYNYLGSIAELFESRFDEWYISLNNLLNDIRNNVTYTYLENALKEYANNAIYDPNSNEIRLRHDNHILSRIDVSQFIIGGTLTGVTYHDNTDQNHPNTLELEFTTNGTPQSIYIPIAEAFSLSNYYTKTDIDAMLSNYGTVKSVSINGSRYIPNNGIVDLGNGFLKGVNFNVTGNNLNIDSSNIAQFTPQMTGVIYVKGQDDETIQMGDYVLIPKGDINGDGAVDIADLNLCINIMLGKDNNLTHIQRANVDGQGSIDIADVNAVMNLMLGKSEREYRVYRCTGVSGSSKSFDWNNPIQLIPGLSYYNLTNRSVIAVKQDGTIDDQSDKFNDLALQISSLWTAIKELSEEGEEAITTIIHQNEQSLFNIYGDIDTSENALIISDVAGTRVTGTGTFTMTTNNKIKFTTHSAELLKVFNDCETQQFVHTSNTYTSGQCVQL